ncbi:hypothetical protein H6G76_19780 [Nostoc sp. FACHB-152]|uniref:hypothetical protein n=1 Tax=unclassified Nostoc TaxID=2593658 RepID=UPI001689A2D9|nr:MULTISPECIES: hypothetical protein [unclassified Nostoc]MBD2449360.1 hypothetical protein [Nostoc sp. FACHB-152]MBD2472939.1 hypothetical protein [Nostoc sp. FACHB-145]
MNNLRSQHEPEVFSAVLKYASMKGEFLWAISNPVINKSYYMDITWENLRIPAKIISGMKIVGFPYLQKETYDNWISINNQSSLLNSLIKNPQVTLLSQEDWVNFAQQYDYRWYIFYTLTRPGFSQDFSQALIQITAHCPAGPPQYGSLLYLERIKDIWTVKSSYGLYSQ